jgi:hypothetical protein
MARRKSSRSKSSRRSPGEVAKSGNHADSTEKSDPASAGQTTGANDPEAASAAGSDMGSVETGTMKTGAVERGGGSRPGGGPARKLRFVLMLFVGLHLVAVFLSYSALIEPSSTHSRLLSVVDPYLRMTHFAADGRPFYLAQGTADEQPHRLQVASGNAGDGAASFEIDVQTEWTNVEPTGVPGLAASDRYERWMRLVAALAEADRHSLAATMLMPLIVDDPSIDAVRIVRLPTELTTVADDAAPPVYLARVVRRGDVVRLVSIESKRLTTFQRKPQSTDRAIREDNSVGEEEQ